MIFYRYELYCDDEPQNVGFIVGLDNLFGVLEGDYNLIDEYFDSLLEPLDNELPFPPAERRQDSVCAFTEFGKMVFCDTIEQIICVYKDTPFEVRELMAEIDNSELDRLSYQDEYQVCIPTDLFNRIKRDANDMMKVRYAA